jgi:hypothetical protein
MINPTPWLGLFISCLIGKWLLSLGPWCIATFVILGLAIILFARLLPRWRLLGLPCLIVGTYFILRYQ